MTVETSGRRGYAAMMVRMVRAYGRRVGMGDPVDLAGMVQLKRTLDAAIRDAVRTQHDEGFSYAEIGEGMGISRQAARATYGRPTFGHHPSADVA